MQYDVFVSYRWVDPDQSWVRKRLVPALQNAGLEPCFDREYFVPSERISREIERCMKESRAVLCVLSPTYFESAMTLKELEIARQLNVDEKKPLFPFIFRKTNDRVPDITPIDWTDPETRELGWKKLLILLKAKNLSADPPWEESNPLQRLNGKLTNTELRGRDAILKELIGAWSDEQKKVAVLVGEGGVGKTAMAWELILRLRESSDPRVPMPEAIYGWSFANQGQESFDATAQIFANEANLYFGNPDGSKFDSLVGLLRQRRCLLVLDGIETRQSADGYLREYKLEERIRYFLQEICDPGKRAAGLVLLTSRYPITEIEGRACYKIEVPKLEDEDGALMLRDLEVEASDETHLRTASRENGGNPFCLVLLAGFLRDKGHSIHRRSLIELPKDEKYAKPVKEMIAGYVALIQPHERAFLRLLGLFGRPMTIDEFSELKTPAPAAADLPRQAAACVALVKEFEEKEGSLSGMYSHLGVLHLLIEPVRKNPWEEWDTHPLIRQHFAEEFRADFAAEWKEAHGILFDFYRRSQEKTQTQPPTENRLIDLLGAVRHGCLAENYRGAYELYEKHIANGFRGYDTEVYSLAAEALNAFSGFFEQGDTMYEHPVQGLDRDQQAWILARASYCLQSLGELHGATYPRVVSNRLHNEMYESSVGPMDRFATARDAAYGAEELAKLQLRLGRLVKALDAANDAVRHAESCNRWEPEAQRDENWCSKYCRTDGGTPIPSWLRVCSSRAARGSVFHRLGAFDDARRDFAEAIEVHRANCTPTATCSNCGLTRTGHCEADAHFVLHSEPGVWYCMFALDNVSSRAEADAVREYAGRMIAWSNHAATASESIKGLHALAHGMATLTGWVLSGKDYQSAHRSDLEEAETELRDAARRIRRSKQNLYLCDVLVQRSAVRRYLGKVDAAREDVEEVMAMASIEKYDMPLSLADASILKGHLELDRAPANTRAAYAAWSDASRCIKQTEYRAARLGAALLAARIAHYRGDGEEDELAFARDALRDIPVARLAAILERYEHGDWNF